MPGAARMLDPSADGLISGPCSPTTFVNHSPAARAGDAHACPHGPGVAGPGSASVFIDGLPALRVGDAILCPMAPSAVVLGSSDVHVG